MVCASRVNQKDQQILGVAVCYLYLILFAIAITSG